MRGLRIGSLLGIPIRLNWTFLLILPLFAWLIGNDIAGLTGLVNDVLGSDIAAESFTEGNLQWVLGTAAALGLFFGVLLHEFGHSLVAMRYGLEIESITLWLLGGVASFREMPEEWSREFLIAAAGPVTSVLVGLASYAGFLAVPADAGFDAARFVLGYLALMNVALAVFNLLPGFPMDGGRILRALLARNRPHSKATRQAAEVGKLFAFVLGIVGLFANLFLVVLAFFIYIAASGEVQQSTLRAAFEDVSVADIMTPHDRLHTVTEQTSVAELMDRMFRERHTGYPVLRGDDLVGMATLEDAQGIREVERDAYKVGEVMATDIVSVTPDAPAMSALELMQEHKVGRLPVIDANGDLVGLVSRTDLMTAFSVIKSTENGGSSFVRRRGGDELPEVR